MNAKHAAQAIRTELKTAFPNFKFKVVSTYNKVTISWTDAMTIKQVEKITDKYQYGNFNGMTDSYEYTNRRNDIPQAQYVFTSRTISDLATELKLKEIQQTFAGADEIGYEDYYENARCWMAQLIHRELYNHSFEFEGQYL